MLIALAIIALVAAVAAPGLARRLDAAFSEADLQQALSSARLLPARVATLGAELSLDDGALRRPLSDGRLPLDIPPGWSIKVEQAPHIEQPGTCSAGALVLSEPAGERAWRLRYTRLTCEVAVLELDESPR